MSKEGVAVSVGAAIVAAGLIVTAPKATPPASPAPNTSLATWDHVHPLPSLTPGVVDPKLTFEVLSAPGFTTKTYRNVPESEKEQVYREYGIASHKTGEFEVDHRVSLTVGGANDPANLWIEAYSINWNGFEAGAHSKDRLEDFLGAGVKSGRIPLPEAQSALLGDWVVAYRKYLGELPKYQGPVTGNPEGE